MLPATPGRLTIAWFDWWCRRALRASFNRVHLSLDAPQQWDAFDPSVPRLYVPNHSSFWDGIVLNHLLRGGPRRAQPLYCMVDEAQARRHPFFRRAGAFGVNRASPRDAARSIDYAVNLLTGSPAPAVIVFPQGQVRPVDARPMRFESGVGRIISRVPGLRVVPVGLRYEFWEDQRAETIVRVGAERTFAGQSRADTVASLEATVSALLDAAREDAIAWRVGDRVVLEGKRSISRWRERLEGRRG